MAITRPTTQRPTAVPFRPALGLVKSPTARWSRTLAPPRRGSTKTSRGAAGRLVEDVRTIYNSYLSAREAQGPLREALSVFAASEHSLTPYPWNRSLGRYPRVLLNDPADGFQIVVVFWPPGSRSAIHDHADTVGGVIALYGELSETKYTSEPDSSGTVRLGAGERVPLRNGSFTPILPEPGVQLHDMRNESLAWGATVHVYLNSITDYHVYAQRPDGTHTKDPRSFWFDYARGAALWDSRPEPPRDAELPDHHRAHCLCGQTVLSCNQPPVLCTLCKCSDCRCDTGGSALRWVFFAAKSLSCEREPLVPRTYQNDSGYAITKSYCHRCHTQMTFSSAASPQMTGVVATTLEQSERYRPEIGLYIDERRPSPSYGLSRSPAELRFAPEEPS